MIRSPFQCERVTFICARRRRHCKRLEVESQQAISLEVSQMKCHIAIIGVVLLSSLAFSQEPKIVPEGAKLEKLWSDGEFTEGPAYGPGGCVYFSDIGNRIMKFDPATGNTSVFRDPSGRANGLDFDPQGRLVAA